MLTCQIDNGFLVTIESFHRVTTSLYGQRAGIEQSFKLALHRSRSQNPIDRDRVTANRDEEKVSSVIID